MSKEKTNQETPKESLPTQIEQAALSYYECTRQIAKAEDTKELLKKKLLFLMKEIVSDSYDVILDENHNLKITVKQVEVKKVDTDQLASDLDIAVSNANKKDVLIDLTEQGKLTLEQYQKYHYMSPEQRVTIRKNAL